MYLNFFKTAIRNFLRHKGHAFINVSGLAVGIAAALLIYVVVRYEYSYDKHFTDGERIFHVITKDNRSGEESYTVGVPYPALKALRLDFPEATIGSLYSSFGSQITVPNETSGTGDKYVELDGVFFFDPEFFSVFTYTWLAGSPDVMRAPNSVVLSRATADKYFGSWTKAMGKRIFMDINTPFVVAGVLEDSPHNSDFQVKVAASFVTLERINPAYGAKADWGSTSSSFQIFFKLPQGLSAQAADNRLLAFSAKNYKKELGSIRVNFLQPLSDNHFDTRVGNLGDHVISKNVLTTLGLIGILIIVMASINFVNLSTARAVLRSKEIGVRKVMGGARSQLFFQMILETFLIVFASSLIGLGLAYIALPYLNKFITMPDNLSLFTTDKLLYLSGLAVVCTLLAGIYPALVLSGFQPATALRTRMSTANVGGLSLRRALVVIQFVISQMLVIGTLVAVKQMNYIRGADLGLNKDAVLAIGGANDSTYLSRLPAFKQSLLKVPGVVSATRNSDLPCSDNNWSSNFAYDRKNDENFIIDLKFADTDYLKTFDLKLIAGSNYVQSDTMVNMVVNRTLTKMLNLKDPSEAVGKEIRIGGQPWKRITGVVEDFKTNSLRQQIRPLLIAPSRKFSDGVAVKLHAVSLSQVSADVKKLWESYFPEYAYYSFYMDEQIERFYTQETRLSSLYQVFSVIAILISCLGLYGLISFMVVQKTKEVGIRKVLGAKVVNIVYLFSKEFTLLILVAFVVAAPLAWYFAQSWLDNFVFKVTVGPFVFLSAAFLSLLIAWASVGYKAIKAALSNPVKSLRTE